MNASPSAPFRTHHLGCLVGDIEAAGRELVECFGYIMESAVIHDPVQTAHVQFFRLPGDSAWFELVAPAGEQSKLAAALRKGGGVHHVCYEVPDIHRALLDLRQKGLFVIAEPVPAVAFSGRLIAWLMGSRKILVELVEAGPGDLRLPPMSPAQ